MFYVASNANTNSSSYCNVDCLYQRPSNTCTDDPYFLPGAYNITAASDYQVFLVFKTYMTEYLEIRETHDQSCFTSLSISSSAILAFRLPNHSEYYNFDSVLSRHISSHKSYSYSDNSLP